MLSFTPYPLDLLLDVDPVVGSQEGEKGHGASEAVIPHRLQLVAPHIQLRLAQEMDVVHGEVRLLEVGLQLAEVAGEEGKAVIVGALLEEVTDGEKSFALVLQQLGGVGDGASLVRYHGEGVAKDREKARNVKERKLGGKKDVCSILPHGDDVDGSGSGEDRKYRGGGEVMLHHAHKIRESHRIDSIMQRKYI